MQQRERWMWISLGGAMLLPVLWKRSLATVALGGGGGYLIWRAAQGASPLSEWRRGRLVAMRSVTIQASPEQVYSAWRHVEDMPKFFPELQEVRELDHRRSHWKMRAGGRLLEWEMEVTEDRPNELLAWSSAPGSNVDESGSLRLRKAPDGRGTVADLTLEFGPPAGPLAMLLIPLGFHPEQVAREGLRRFKQWIETGEIATIEGQPHGPRSPLAKILPAFEPGHPRRVVMPAREPVPRTGTR